MAIREVLLAYVDQGAGDPVLLIHGSWDDHYSWESVANKLANGYRVLSYDRRGHSASTEPPGQGSLTTDVEDARRFIEKIAAAPVYVVGHSYGASIAIAFVLKYPPLARSLFVHEPPIFGLLSQNRSRAEVARHMRETAVLIETGKIERGVVHFVENVAFGEGSWNGLFDDRARAIMLANADTWLDQNRDPERLLVDVRPLRRFPNRMTVSVGDRTLPVFREVCARMRDLVPELQSRTVIGGGHGSHVSHPEQIARLLREHLQAADI